jgi:hypothetical protein
MTKKLKSNDNIVDTKIVLPLPPEDRQAHSEMEIYSRFMRYLRLSPSHEAEVKILSSIQFTADLLDIGEALVSKTLVDLGLRATRKAFPTEYLNHVDDSLLRSGWDVGGPTAGIAELKAHWDKIGEDKFAPYRREMFVAGKSPSYDCGESPIH